MVDNIVSKPFGLFLIVAAHLVFNGKLSSFSASLDVLHVCVFSPARGSFLLLSVIYFLCFFFVLLGSQYIACSYNTSYYAANDTSVSTQLWCCATIPVIFEVLSLVSVVVLPLHIEHIKMGTTCLLKCQVHSFVTCLW